MSDVWHRRAAGSRCRHCCRPRRRSCWRSRRRAYFCGCCRSSDRRCCCGHTGRAVQHDRAAVGGKSNVGGQIVRGQLAPGTQQTERVVRQRGSVVIAARMDGGEHIVGDHRRERVGEVRGGLHAKISGFSAVKLTSISSPLSAVRSRGSRKAMRRSRYRPR